MNIVELAKKAGLKVGTNISGVTLIGSPCNIGLAHINVDEMQCFASLVLEEAAKVCENMQQGWPSDDQLVCAAAIRALKGAKK